MFEASIAPSAPPAPDHLVDLVEEENDLAARLAHLAHHGLQPLLELAPELGAGDQRAHVEGEHALVAQPFRHVAGGDALREALDDRGLADAGLADQHGVVLRAAVEHLHQPLDLDGAADHRVELAQPRQLREVRRVAAERLVLRVGGGGVDTRAAAHLAQRGVDALPGDAVLLEDRRRLAVAHVGDGDQQVLDADELVLEAVGLAVGGVEQPDDAGGRVNLHHVMAELGRAVEVAADAGGERLHVDAQLAQHLARDALGRLGDGEEDVLDVPLRVPLLAHELLRGLQDGLRLLREPVLSHHRRITLRTTSRPVVS